MGHAAMSHRRQQAVSIASETGESQRHTTMTNTFVRNDPDKARRYFEDKMTFTTGPVELDRAISEKQDIVVVDVRAAEDFDEGHIRGAVSLPRGKWGTEDGLRKDQLNVLYCYSHVCHLSAAAAVEFARRGYP